LYKSRTIDRDMSNISILSPIKHSLQNPIVIFRINTYLLQITAMPFDFDTYDEKCSEMSPEELSREWNHYTRLITGSSTSTTISGLALPFTLGISGIGILIGSAGIHNARKKRAIIDRHLARHQEQHRTRVRDVMGSMMFSGAVGVATLGVGGWGAEALMAEGLEHGVVTMADEMAVKAVAHAAADGAGLALEHNLHHGLKEQAEKNA
jgi:hypothetical protein